MSLLVVDTYVAYAYAVEVSRRHRRYRRSYKPSTR